MDLSVVIPTFNRARLLRQSIPALIAQESVGFSYEVIFVMNGSTDESSKVLEEASQRNPSLVRYFWIEPTGGPSAPRNVGIRAATGNVVVILDDDVVPDTDMVRQHLEFHRRCPEANHAAVGELYTPPETTTDPMALFHNFPYHELRNRERLSYLFFWTCNVSFKREFMLRHGMFDESFLAYEDMICGYQLCRAGMHLHFLESARGQHLHQIRAEGVPAKGLWYGRWLYRLEQHLPDRELKIRFGILSPDIGMLRLARRSVKRFAFRLVDNPLTIGTLRLLGAENGKRTRVSDFYYFLVFRRNLLAGYAEVKRQTRMKGDVAGQAASPNGGDHRSPWVYRGE